MKDFAHTLARLRSGRGFSYTRLARRVPCSHTYLWQLETQGNLPERVMAQAIDAALDAGGQLLATLPEEVSPVTTPLTVADLPELRETITHLVGLDGLHGSGGLHRRAGELYAGYRRRLARCVDPEVWAAVAEVGQVAAWLAYDASRPGVSQRLLEAVLPLAAGTPIETLCLDQLANLAYDRQAPAEALRFAQRGLAGVPGGVVRGMFEARAARAYGLMGLEVEARTAMSRARGWIEAGPRAGEAPQSWWITGEDFLVHQGGLELDLGHPAEAVTIRSAALERAGNLAARERALCAGYLAAAYAAAGDRHTALELIGTITPPTVRVRELFARVRRSCG